MYKITFTMTSPLSYLELPTFDGILSYCYYVEKFGIPDGFTNLDAQKCEELFDNMPLTKHHEGYFMASWLMFDETEHLESTEFWTKQWSDVTDHIVTNHGKRRNVNISSGEFKAYNQKILVHQHPKTWFFFDSEDVEQVRELIEKHLWGIGKKVNAGYGKFSGFEIEKICHNPFLSRAIRPIPISKQKRVEEYQLIGWKPPYWLPANQMFCYAQNYEF